MYKPMTRILLPLILLCFFFYSANAQDQAAPSQWFDSYGAISWNEEKLHLDNFAYHLKQNPDQIGYLLYYVGKGNAKTRVTQRCMQARRFLTKVRKIEAARIVIIYAGRSDETKFVLQPISKDLPPPRFPKN